MPRLRRALLLLLPGSLGCTRTSDAPADDSGAAALEACSTCALEDANNFAYESSLALTVHDLAEEADVAIDWRALTHDVRGGALDPYAGVDEAWLVVFQDVEPAALTEAIAEDRMQQESVTLFVTCTPVDAACTFGDFAFLGNDLGVAQYFTEGRGSWLVVLYSQAEGIVQSMGLLQARADATATTVSLTDADAALSAEVDLHSLTPVAIAPGTTDVTLSWSGLTTDGLGNPLSVYTLDRLLVGRYPQGIPELETDFFALEALAAETWEVSVDGRDSAGLGELVGETAFTGITTEDTWMLALLCSSCENPSPRFLTRLQPTAP